MTSIISLLIGVCQISLIVCAEDECRNILVSSRCVTDTHHVHTRIHLCGIQSQGIVRPFTYNAFIAFLLASPITWALVSRYGFLGGAWAQSIITVIQFILDTGYVVISGVYKKTWLDFNIKKASLSLKPMLKLGALSLVMSSGTIPICVLVHALLLVECLLLCVPRRGRSSSQSL